MPCRSWTAAVERPRPDLARGARSMAWRGGTRTLHASALDRAPPTRRRRGSLPPDDLPRWRRSRPLRTIHSEGGLIEPQGAARSGLRRRKARSMLVIVPNQAARCEIRRRWIRRGLNGECETSEDRPIERRAHPRLNGAFRLRRVLTCGDVDAVGIGTANSSLASANRARRGVRHLAAIKGVALMVAGADDGREHPRNVHMASGAGLGRPKAARLPKARIRHGPDLKPPTCRATAP